MGLHRLDGLLQRHILVDHEESKDHCGRAAHPHGTVYQHAACRETQPSVSYLPSYHPPVWESDISGHPSAHLSQHPGILTLSDGATEAQRGKGTVSRPHSKLVAELKYSSWDSLLLVQGAFYGIFATVVGWWRVGLGKSTPGLPWVCSRLQGLSTSFSPPAQFCPLPCPCSPMQFSP